MDSNRRNSRLPVTRMITTFALSLLAAAPGFAQPGVIEINQAAALAGGITATDAPGFPVTLDSSGGYRLTGNLDASGSPAVDAIEVSSAGVDLDLAGFSVVGAHTCSGVGAAISCTGSGAGRGIDAGSALRFAVRNGTVRGFDIGVYIGGAYSRVSDLTIRHNTGDGLRTWTNAVIENVVSTHNGSDGIDMGGISTGNALVAAENGSAGLRVGVSAVVSNVVATGNGSDGVYMSGLGAMADRVVVTKNGGDGLEVGISGGTVTALVASDNAVAGVRASGSLKLDSASISGNGTGGMVPGNGSVISRSAIFHNTGAGLYIGTDLVLVGDTSISANTQDEIHVAGPENILMSNPINCNGADIQWSSYLEEALSLYCDDF